MQELQQRIEERQGLLVRLVVYRLSVGRLDHFEVPTGELVPEQFVYGHEGFAQTVLLEQVCHFPRRGSQHGIEPACGDGCRFRLCDVGRLPAFHETECVPYLVVEVAALFAECVVEQDVVACRGGQHHSHTHAVGTVAFYQIERVGAVTQRLAHLASKFVAHDTGEVHVLERHLPFVFVACHDHARHPEEDDVRTRYEVGRGVVVTEFLVARVVDAVEQGNRPQPTGEPSVQCVLVLTEVGCGQVGIAGFFLGQFECFFSGLGHHESALRQVVSRDAVAPPQLSADAPVLDVFHPVTVSIFVFGRVELDFVLHHRFQSDLRQVFHLQEPLHGKLRFDGYVGTLGEAHLVGIVFHLFQQSGFF